MTLVSPEALADWQARIGTSETQHQVLEVESLRRYALAMDADPAVETAQPPLGHWAFFLPGPTDAELAHDGHERRGGFIPAITLPRRMFAGGTFQFSAPLNLGKPADMVSTIADVAYKQGRTGELVFVEVERVISQDGSERVRERQSLVYREMGDPVPMPVPAAQAPEGECWFPNEVHLMRFSAATFNGHRIHYDKQYVTEVEGYPALIIHGPLTAAKLCGMAMRKGPLAEFSFRAQAPLFLGQPVYLRQSGEETFEAVRCDGMTAMTATVR